MNVEVTMTVKRNGRAGLGVLIGVVLMAACSRSSTGNDALKRDLDLAGSTSLELAPRASGTQVVSAVEESPGAVPARSTARVRAPAKSAAPRAPARQTAARTPERPQPEPIREAELPSESSALPATPAPTPTPVPTPQRRGGYKSVGEIIRNAPFPINP